MHLLSVFSLRNRALIALVTIVVGVFGGIALTTLKQELIPSVTFPQLVIVTTYPGAAPEVVNTDVSTPIETAIQAVSGLEDTTATSSTNISTVSASFAYGTNIATAEQNVTLAVNRIRSTLPDDVEPQVITGSIEDLPVVQIAVTSDLESNDLSALLEDSTLTEIQKLDGVREADLLGTTAQRITITPDAALLTAAGQTNQNIRDALDANGTLLPGGSITEDDQTLTVQAGTRLASADDVAALPLVGATSADGGVVSISDVATVATVDDPVTGISRVNGEPSLTIAVTKTPAGNTVAVSREVIDLIPTLEDDLGVGTKLTVVFDQAPFIEQSIESLATEGGLGLLFAVIVILVFLLSLRSTLVTAISIPASVLITFIGMLAAGYTLNIITLGALTIAIGRVVDDSIVVIENIKRHLSLGEPKLAAITTAVREVAAAITASTVTTVAVFLPLALVGDITGELFRPFALTVTIALAASLFVALTIVPVLAYWFLKTPTPEQVEAATAKADAAELERERRATERARRAAERAQSPAGIARREKAEARASAADAQQRKSDLRAMGKADRAAERTAARHRAQALRTEQRERAKAERTARREHAKAHRTAAPDSPAVAEAAADAAHPSRADASASTLKTTDFRAPSDRSAPNAGVDRGNSVVSSEDGQAVPAVVPAGAADTVPEPDLPLRRHRHAGDGLAAESAERPSALQRAYLPVVRWTLRWRWVTVALAVLILVGTVALVPSLKTNFIGDSGQNTLTVSQSLPLGTSLEAQDAAASTVEDALLDIPGIDIVQLSIGQSGSSIRQAFIGSGSITYSITTDPDVDQAQLQQDVRAELTTLDDVGELSLEAAASGFASSDIEINITASGQGDLDEASDRVLSAVRDLPVTAEASSNLSEAQPFIAIDVDRDLAAQAGLTEIAVGGIVAESKLPAAVGSVVVDEKTLSIYIDDPDAPETVQALRDFSIPSARGPIPLTDVATVEQQDGPSSITTIRGLRAATISITPGSDDVGTASSEVAAALEGVDLPGGATAEIGGVTAQQGDAFGQLSIALLVAILIVYVVMVATFKSLRQPLELLVSVPFAATGAILLQVISGIPLGVPSFIGLLMLVGIVVTNAIVLVDLINQYRVRGLSAAEAIVEGASRRLRPILMTATATIFALLPLAVGLTGTGGFISQPLAIIVIGGLVSSTVLTLVVLPALYYLIEGAKERRIERRAARDKRVAELREQASSAATA